MYSEDIETFRHEARMLGLAYEIVPEKERSVVLDVAHGTIFAPLDPEKIRRLVQLASTYAYREDYGEDRLLLNLSIRRSDLNNLWLVFQRDVDIMPAETGHWMSLREWLAECGFPYAEAVEVFE